MIFTIHFGVVFPLFLETPDFYFLTFSDDFSLYFSGTPVSTRFGSEAFASFSVGSLDVIEWRPRCERMPCGRKPAAGWVVSRTKKRMPPVGVSRLTKVDVSLVSQHGCFFFLTKNFLLFGKDGELATGSSTKIILKKKANESFFNRKKWVLGVPIVRFLFTS